MSQMIEQTRGYNVITALRGGQGYPNNLQPAPGEPAISTGEFFRRLAAAGCNRIRVKMVAPQGNVNDWGGRLGGVVSAARQHGVTLHAIVFDNVEFLRYWSGHAWNAATGGFITDARDAFTDARALRAAEARLDFLIAAAGDVISCWEVMAEMTWMMTPGFWGVADWGAMPKAVHGIAVPWVEHIVQYIHANHGAPVGNGHVRDLGGGVEIRNEVYRTPSLDFALMNWYGDGPLANKVAALREAQAYVGKRVYVEQYAPWDLGTNPAYTPEPDTFAWSKAHEWAAACGEYGFVGPLRWPEIRPKDSFNQWWGVAHPNMAAIAGVTAEMARRIDLDDWIGYGEVWDRRITSNGLTVKSAWGDGQHVTVYLQWGASGPHAVQVSGLADQSYSVTAFDPLTGAEAGSDTLDATGGTLAITNLPGAARALYIARTAEGPGPGPDPERIALVVRDPATGAEHRVTLDAGKTYEMRLERETG